LGALPSAIAVNCLIASDRRLQQPLAFDLGLIPVLWKSLEIFVGLRAADRSNRREAVHLVDFSPNQPQRHGPKKSPDRAADGDQGQETNEQTYLGCSPFASVSVSGDVPNLIGRQDQKDE
jgi:hypothetical protein